MNERDWALPKPAATIFDIAEERGWTENDLARHLPNWQGIAAGHPIDAGTAASLASILGSTPRFWLALDKAYQADKAQRRQRTPIKKTTRNIARTRVKPHQQVSHKVDDITVLFRLLALKILAEKKTLQPAHAFRTTAMRTPFNTKSAKEHSLEWKEAL